MKKKLIFFGSLLLGIILTIIIYLSFDNILSPFKGVPLIILIGYIFTVLLIHLIHTIRWKIILKTTNHNIPLRKLFIYRLMGFSLNYITPTAHIGGEPLKAAMLKENDVPYSEGVSSLFIDKFLEVVADGFFAILGLSIVLLGFTLSTEKKFEFIGASVLCVFILTTFFFNILKRRNPMHLFFRRIGLHRVKGLRKFEPMIRKMGDNIHSFFLKHTLEFKISIFLSFLMWGLMFVEYKLLFLMLGFDATLFQLFIIITFVGLAYILPVPAALGVLEAGQLSAFSILSLANPLAITASIVIRAKDLIITFVGLVFISIKGLGAFKSLKETE